jgi:hypothetical protein
MNPFEWLVLVVVCFLIARTLWWVLVQIPEGHVKDDAICEICLGKVIEDKVTKPLEWCDCPNKKTTDKHGES